MKLVVRDPNGNELASVDFKINSGAERRVSVRSSTGGTFHAFQDTTPEITVEVPAVIEGDDAPANNVAHISEAPVTSKESEITDEQLEAGLKELEAQKEEEKNLVTPVTAAPTGGVTVKPEDQTETEPYPETETEQTETAPKITI